MGASEPRQHLAFSVRRSPEVVAYSAKTPDVVACSAKTPNVVSYNA
jgi:hypothetical protein